ncbi:hypothetical protein HDU97_002460 [Phlyctochytrium planicorne]|nr:hypothetical protein HDU97_002460 [Phlyctochytrium planicorne]
MDPVIRQLKLKQCATECKLDAALVSLREAEYLSRKGRRSTANETTPDAPESGLPDLSNECCHICSRDEGREMMVCSNEKPRESNREGRKRKKTTVLEGSEGGKVCRNVICRACFVKEGWDWEHAEGDEHWQCCHCKGECPQRAQCKLKVIKALAASRIRASYESDDEEEEQDESDEICAICNEHGELMCCDGCPAAFHIKCLGLDSVPDTEWHCNTCQLIQKEIDGNPKWRSEPVVLSLFDGIGAAYVAFRRLGVRPSVYLSSEIHDVACEVLDTYASSHNGNVVQVGDVTKFKPSADLPRLLKGVVDDEAIEKWTESATSGFEKPAEPLVDLLVGGSPCTDLSFLGQGAGVVEGQQSSFFFEYVRILRESKPRWFLFENVRMRLSDMNIISKELGVKPTFVDSVDLSPCRRKRLFWTNIPIRKIPQVLQDRPLLTHEIVLDEAIPELSKAQCITRGNSSPHLGDSRFNVLWYPDGKRRSYHPVEIERLMGFPDFYTEVEQSRIQRHGMLGNSFSVYSVAHILGGLFKGDIVAPELEWKGSKNPAPQSVALAREPATSSQRTDVDVSLMKPLPPLENVPPRLTIGERDKLRRVLRRLQKLAQHVSIGEVPGSATMPGFLVPDYNHRYVVLVNDAKPGNPPSWSTAIIVPESEWDNTMPLPSRRSDQKQIGSSDVIGTRGSAKTPTKSKKGEDDKNYLIIRYFSNGAYGPIIPWTADVPVEGEATTDGSNSPPISTRSGGKMVCNLRLLSGDGPAAEPAATMEKYLPGWSQRKDVVKAFEAAADGKISVSMKWVKWKKEGEVSKNLWSGKMRLQTAVPEPKSASKPSTGRRRGRPSNASRLASRGASPEPEVVETKPERPTLATIMARVEASVPELVLDENKSMASVVRGGYTSIDEVEKELRQAVDDIVASSDGHADEIREVFEKEWENNEEVWLSEGRVVFVVPHKFMRVKDNQIWWPGMIIPLEELDDSIPVRSTTPGSYVVRYFEDSSCSVVTSKALAPFDPENEDPQTGNLKKLMDRFGEQAVKSHPSIRKALRYVCTGLVPPGFPWSLWGCSQLYRTGPPPKEEVKQVTNGHKEGEEDGPEKKRAKLDDDLVVDDGIDRMVKRCKKCQVTETVCWRNGTDGPQTLCNDCGLKLYLEMVPRVPITELSNERFIESQDKSKNNSEHRYYTTRRPLPFPVWDSLGGGMLDANFKLKEGFTLPSKTESSDVAHLFGNNPKGADKDDTELMDVDVDIVEVDLPNGVGAEGVNGHLDVNGGEHGIANGDGEMMVVGK